LLPIAIAACGASDSGFGTAEQAVTGEGAQPLAGAAPNQSDQNPQPALFENPPDFFGTYRDSDEITPALRAMMVKAAELQRKRNPAGVDKRSLGFGADVPDVPEPKPTTAETVPTTSASGGAQ
jgi:hypothetical protein